MSRHLFSILYLAAFYSLTSGCTKQMDNSAAIASAPVKQGQPQPVAPPSTNTKIVLQTLNQVDWLGGHSTYSRLALDGKTNFSDYDFEKDIVFNSSSSQAVLKLGDKLITMEIASEEAIAEGDGSSFNIGLRLKQRWQSGDVAAEFESHIISGPPALVTGNLTVVMNGERATYKTIGIVSESE